MVNATSGFHWGKRIAVVYVTFALCILGFVGFALTQSVDLVREDYYESSLSFDKKARAINNAKRLGSEVAIVVTENGTIELKIPHRSIERGTLLCYRPDNPKLDRLQPFTPVNGIQMIKPNTLQPGRWVLQLQWTSGGLEYEYSTNIDLWNS